MVATGPDVAACRDTLKPIVMFYISSGAGNRNFYKEHLCRMGYEEAAVKVPGLYLDGHVSEAIDAVPDDFIDEIALCGPVERVVERLDAWRVAGADTVLLATSQREALPAIAERVL
jgi:alkanesulfonate monooxygenase SsuD/methylene tetrahydromethanopterin reductase-like flavin-dependent oxidoreductase (luciferase family)